MAKTVKVPAQFAADFEEYCRLSGLYEDPADLEEVRAAIRSNLTHGMEFVRRSLWVYRYCHAKWGRLPTVDECREALGPDADPVWFQREGILILAGRCAIRDGVPFN